MDTSLTPRLLVWLAFLMIMPVSMNGSAYETGFEARKQELLERVAAAGWQPTPNFSNAHIHYWATALATIETSEEGVMHPAVNDGTGASSRAPIYWGILKYDGEAASGSVTEAGRGTGSLTSFSWNSNVYHFIFPGLAMLMGMYPDIPAWEDPHHRNAEMTYRENYLRYVLTRTDNYNAFTGEGTENHINMSRPSAWVLASEAERLGLSFPGQPFTAAERKAQMREWIMAWSRRLYEVGNGEWDSGTYHMITLEGWFAAHEYAGTARGWDPEVQAATKAVLDFYATALAVKHVNYHFAGAESRSGRNFTRMDNGTAYLAYLWFADTLLPPPGSWRGNQGGEAVYAAISSYRPPLRIVELARRTLTEPETYQSLKPRYLMQAGGQTVEEVHIDPAYTLGSANMNIGGFHSSVWQIFPWKLMVGSPVPTDFPAYVLSGNGGFYGIGIVNTRDPWMQIVQHRNVLVQMHRVPADAATIVSAVQTKYNEWKAGWYNDFTARWAQPDWGGFGGDTYAGRQVPLNFQANTGNVVNARTAFIKYPAGVTVGLEDNIRFMQLGSGATGVYVAIRSIQNTAPAVNTQNRLISDTAAAGALFGLVMEVGTAREFGSFDGFKAAVRNETELDLSMRDSALEIRYTNVTGEVIRAQYQTSGTWTEPDYDWNYGVTTPGGVALMHTASWRQPDWPDGEGHGRQPIWWIDGEQVNPYQRPVLSGPRVRLEGGRLSVLMDQEAVYTVDYAEAVPTFIIPVTPAELLRTVDGVRVQIAARLGLQYQLESSSDLRSWTPLSDSVPGGNAILSFEVTESGPNAAFYRFVVRP